jgi:hypothetical protein
MGIFKRKNKAKKSRSDETTADRGSPKGLKTDSNRQQRSKVDEEILRNGPDKGFVWYEEA